MRCFITFLEGVISFLSPCMLPLLPVYVSYFAPESLGRGRALVRSLCFVLGFTLCFSLLGLFAGSLGSLLLRWRRWVNLVTGIIVILFGLGYLELIPLPFFKGMKAGRQVTGALSAFVFGLVYSVSLTPCVGAFLGSALMLASGSATAGEGLVLLLCYSAGLGLPFLLFALLLEQLGGAVAAIKKHYKTINLISGLFLVAVGLCMALGLLERVLAAVS